MIFSIKNEQGLQLAVHQSDKDEIEYEVISGGDGSNPTWEEYLQNWKEDFRGHIILLRQAIEQMDWVGKTGGEVCNETVFVFSDGLSIGFTWRAWGDLMQSIVGKNEGYMMYYM